jgi:hypothetical protein
MRVLTALVVWSLSVGAAGAQSTQTYFYDVQGRLQAATLAPASGGTRVRYGLDAADNRTSRNGEVSAGRAVLNELQSGEDLLPNQRLPSLDGRFFFIVQTEGNAVIYGPSGALWSNNTTTGRSTVMAMQGDGNLVIRGPANEAVWDSGTSGHSGARLVMQNDGNLVIYDGSTFVWASGTGGH